MSRPLRVFLCHASQDKPAVWKLYRYLKQHGIQPWLDQEDLLPGQDWRMEIPKAIDISDVILVCLSKKSVNKEGYVQAEITFALDKALEKPEGTIFIIPVKLEECDIPKRLGRYQWVDLSRTDGRKRLLMGLNKRATDLGVDISPVLLEDARQRKASPKPSAAENNENETSMSARILATAKSIHEQKEREDREKAELEAMNGEAQKSAESVVPNADEREKEQKHDRAVGEAKYLKDILESIDGVQTKAVRPVWPVSEGLVEKEAPLSGEHKPAVQPMPKSNADRQSTKPKIPMWMVGLLALLGLISLSLWGVSQYTPKQAIPTSTPSPTVRPTTTIPSSTKSPTTTPTETPTELSLGIGSTMIGKDGMVLMYVPAGEFKMGGYSSDDPMLLPHQVTLNSFWIDRTEVTNIMYAKCVDAGVCKLPKNMKRFDDVVYANHPVVYVSWYDAIAYCTWVNRRLPTEAEWEKAGRGPNGNQFPWGNDWRDTELLADTITVGKYPDEKSYYGAYDMADWVWEWTSSLYRPYPYNANDGREDLSSADTRVLRGGTWAPSKYVQELWSRLRYDPTLSYLNISFRCASSP